MEGRKKLVTRSDIRKDNLCMCCTICRYALSVWVKVRQQRCLEGCEGGRGWEGRERVCGVRVSRGERERERERVRILHRTSGLVPSGSSVGFSVVSVAN